MKRLEYEGTISLVEQEGGFVSSAIYVGDLDTLDSRIAQDCGLEIGRTGTEAKFGKGRIVVELFEVEP